MTLKKMCYHLKGIYLILKQMEDAKSEFYKN